MSEIAEASRLSLSKEGACPPERESSLLAGDQEMIREFVMESREHLATIERQMLLLEREGTSIDLLHAVFRAFHTIKGLSGFLDFTLIQAVAHEVETLLDHARNSRLEMTSAVVDVMLESTDVLRLEIDNIEAGLAGETAREPQQETDLLERIRTLTVAGTATLLAEAAEIPTDRIQEQSAESRRIEPVRTVNQVAESGSLRIDTAKLDQLMDLVGEMVIAQTLIAHSPGLEEVKDARFVRDLTHLARITADVQRITTGMRMVPVGLQFQKTARLVRDLSRKAGKQITFETSGEETEVDKTIAEELSDPLLHMVRNSIDHGIETPDERMAAGKDPSARIRVAAYHQSGQIVIAISDDGRGLNRERILSRALANGLISSEAQLSDNEIYQLIFEAGFSTAEKVTDISGRGVGMDVVRKHVQKLRGRIEIQSKAGEGTTFFLKLPLTLAIIEGLVVVVGSHRYVVPIFSVKEMMRPTREMVSTVQGKGEMALVRDTLLPVIRLHRRFEVEPHSQQLTEGVLIVAESEGFGFCLFVDELVGKQEVVIKSLGQSFRHVVGVAGCAILGDGRVGLILDLDGIVRGKMR